jgi:ribonuclease HII
VAGSSERPSPPTGRRTGSGSSSARRKRRTAARLFRFDRSFGRRFVAGVDEAGRGSLAGPLLAAGVLLDLERIGRSERRALARLDDSKQKSPEEREELYPQVIRAAACVSVAVRSVRAIDRFGLHVSNLGALTDCMRGVAQDEATRLVDGFRLPACELEHTPVVDGDARSAAIAAASVIAKVTRDRYMHRVAALYPDWSFEGNVGYSTPEHRDAILRHGICPLHRRSFASVAYSQLGLEEFGPGIREGAGLERGADVIDIRDAIRAEADPDDVEAIARDA